MSDKINAGIVLVSQFTVAGSSTFQGYIDYIDRSAATRNDNADKYMMLSLNDELLKYNDYMGYMSNPKKTTELFTAGKNQLTMEEKQALKRAFQIAQENGSVMWQTVISFDNRWLEEQGLYDSETREVDERELKQITRLCVDKMLKAEGLYDTVWSAAVHYNTDNLHIHIAITEPHPSTEIIQEGIYKGQRKGKWKKKTLLAGKSAAANYILKMNQTYRLLNEALKKYETAFKEPAQNTPLSMNSGTMLGEYLDIMKTLPEQRKYWTYNHNKMKALRPKLNFFLEKWLNENYKEDFEQFKENAAQLEEIYTEAYGNEEENHYAENQLQKLYTSLGNVVLKSMKRFSFQNMHEDIIEKRIDYEDEAVSIHLEEDAYNDYLAWREEQELDDCIPLEDFPGGGSKAPDDNEKAENLEEEPMALDYNAAYVKFSPNYKKARNFLYGTEYIHPNPKKAFQLLTLEARLGNTLAIYDLAYLYSRGIGCEANQELSQTLYLKAYEGFQKGLGQAEESGASNFLYYLEYRIAKMLYSGLGVEKNMEEAFYLFQSCNEDYRDNAYPKENGYSYAEYYLARFYEEGNVIEKDLPKAFAYYSDICERNLREKNVMPHAFYKLAYLYENGLGTSKDEKEAAKFYRDALKSYLSALRTRPDDFMQYRIGMMYLKGKGVSKNVSTAIKYFELSAKAGNDMAACCLARIYLNQQDPNPEKVKEALKLLHTAADERNSDLAQYQLGKLYIKDDTPRGMKYFSLAAEQGNHHAQYQLGKCYIKEEHYEKAIDMFTKSAEQKNTWACYQLGKLYTRSDIPFFDPQKAISFYQKSAEQNNAFSQYQLGSIYLKGELTEAKPIKAINLLHQAAEQNHVAACYKLGILYLKGEVVGADGKKAMDYLNRAAKQDNPYAQYQLGLIYTQGDIVRKDIQKAVAYFEASAKQGNDFAFFQLGRLYYFGVPGQLEAQYEIGIDYLEKASAKGNEAADMLLERIYNPKIRGTASYKQQTYLSNHMANLFRELGREYQDNDYRRNEQAYDRLQRQMEYENLIETEL